MKKFNVSVLRMVEGIQGWKTEKFVFDNLKEEIEEILYQNTECTYLININDSKFVTNIGFMGVVFTFAFIEDDMLADKESDLEVEIIEFKTENDAYNYLIWLNDSE